MSVSSLCGTCGDAGKRTHGNKFRCEKCKKSWDTDTGAVWITRVAGSRSKGKLLARKASKARVTRSRVTPKSIGLVPDKNVTHKRTHIIHVKDHSGSMAGAKSQAMLKASNELLEEIQKKCDDPNHEITLSTITFGPVQIANSYVDPRHLAPQGFYATSGDTPLFDALAAALSLGEHSPYYSDPETSVHVHIFTDGRDEPRVPEANNPSMLRARIAQLYATGRWTITLLAAEQAAIADFGQKVGLYADNMKLCVNSSFGISEGAAQVISGTAALLADRAKGIKSKRNFFEVGVAKSFDPAKLIAAGKLLSCAAHFKSMRVDREADISEFVKSHNRGEYTQGSAFYKLTKDERNVQSYKKVLLRNNKTGEIFADAESANKNSANVRECVGLPCGAGNADAPATPALENSDFDVFVQSTSYNRKLVRGTELLYEVTPVHQVTSIR